MNVLIVTGMSGSGKTKTLNVLEDSGYYCLDNLPAKLMPDVIDMMLASDECPQKLCVTLDVRNLDVSAEALRVITRLKDKVSCKIVFLDCLNDILVKRYKESRRLHPFMIEDDKLDLEGAIERERRLLESIRQHADYVIETSLFSTGDLKQKILSMIPEAESGQMAVDFVAFGYKYGIPSDCDLVFDVRCLPNPFYVDSLKGKTGEDEEVRDYVMASEDSQMLMERITSYLDTAIPLYIHEGKSRLVVGLGCTGGQHRSLTFAILLTERYSQRYVTHVSARDKKKRVL